MNNYEMAAKISGMKFKLNFRAVRCYKLNIALADGKKT